LLVVPERILKAFESAVRGNLISPNFLTIILCVLMYVDRFINFKSVFKSIPNSSRQLHSMYRHKTVTYCRHTARKSPFPYSNARRKDGTRSKTLFITERINEYPYSE
jgi:hypothetical protein